MIRLQDLTLQAYLKLKDSGMLWVHYPDATGNFNDDLQAVVRIRYSDYKEDYAGGCKIKHLYFYDIKDEEAEYET